MIRKVAAAYELNCLQWGTQLFTSIRVSEVFFLPPYQSPHLIVIRNYILQYHSTGKRYCSPLPGAKSLLWYFSGRLAHLHQCKLSMQIHRQIKQPFATLAYNVDFSLEMIFILMTPVFVVVSQLWEMITSKVLLDFGCG